MHGDEENAQECNDEADDDVSSSDEDVPLNVKHATQQSDADAEDSDSSEDKADIENDKDADMETYKDVDDSALPDDCLLYTSPSPRDLSTSRMPSSA